MIKDSGERRQFDTGAVRDIQEGKGRCDLLPLDAISSIYANKTDSLGARGVLTSIAGFTTTGQTFCLMDALEYFMLDDVPFGDCNWSTMWLEVSKHFEEGAKKYGEHNWQKGIPVKCYIDSAVRHYLKWLRGDKDEPHDRAFVWNIVCCIWTCIHKPELNEYKDNREIYPDGFQPIGWEAFYKLCPTCKNKGSDKCFLCKAERESGYERKGGNE